MIIVTYYKSDLPEFACENAKIRRKKARINRFEQAKKEKALVNNALKNASGTTLTVLKALSMPTAKSIHAGAGSCCLPNIALFRV